MTSFSQFAAQKMIDLYHNHSNEVGSELKKTDPALYSHFTSTDCITYVLNVLSHAYEKSGDMAFARDIWTYGKDPNDPGKRFKGSILGRKLVSEKKWVGIYVNPDVVHPRDASDEHTFTYFTANKHCHYHRIPVQYKAVNYNPTPAAHPNFGKLFNKGETALNLVDVASLKNVLFGVGMSRGDTHTWLFTKGTIYEVHWDGIGSTLYEKTPIEYYPWLSSIILVPPDGKSSIVLAALHCACSVAP
jgi:hypothetical protein